MSAQGQQGTKEGSVLSSETEKQVEAYFKQARRIEFELNQERSNLRRHAEEIVKLKNQLAHHSSEMEIERQRAAKNQELLMNQLRAFQQNEKKLCAQWNEMKRQLDQANEDKKKAKLNLENTRIQIENLKKKEEKILSEQKNSGATLEGQIEKLAQERTNLNAELGRYRQAWQKITQVDQKARSFLGQYEDLKKKAEEADQRLLLERKRSSELEAKLIHTQNELENIKDRTGYTLRERGLELQF